MNSSDTNLENQNTEIKNSKKSNKVLIIILILIILGLGGYICYDKIIMKEDSNKVVEKNNEKVDSKTDDSLKNEESDNESDNLDNENIENEEQIRVEIEEMKDDECFGAYISGKFIIGDDGCLDFGNKYIYTLTKDPIIKGYEWWKADIKDNYAYAFDGNKVTKYDTKGNIINTFVEKNIIQIVDNLGIKLEGQSLSIINLDTNKEISLGIIKDGYTHEPYGTNYYDKESVDEKHEPGYYITFVNWDLNEDNVETDNEGNPLNAIEYYYIPDTGKTGEIITFVGGYAKPVLYLYPQEDSSNITVTFEKTDLLTTTYPKFKNSWNVTANKNGDLYDNDGKYYYGLYWEESGSTKVDFSEGFYVTKDNAIEFLEEKLSIIGLSDRERNEFIMYWLPILEKNEKNLVYFELTEEREAYNKLNISPKPDSLLRMAIHVKKVNKKIDIKEQKLESFERKGFIAVEWGGVVH